MRGCLRSRSERQPSRSEHSACPSPVHAEATDSRRERSACVTLHIKICLCLIRTERLMTTSAAGLPETLEGLRAAAEETRLRILALLAEGELSVSDLTDILGQSQPRISRHLKLLVEAGLVERDREGAWAFFRLTDRGVALRIMRPTLESLDRADQRLLDDRTRLAAVRSQRAQAAQAFFSRLAPDWDRIRSLHAPETVVEAAVLDALGTRSIRNLVDLGTGTGRMLQLLAPRAQRTVGLDASHAMLSVARANLEKAGLRGIELRQGDIYAPPFPRDTFDLVVIHQVLHYLDDPARAIREAALDCTLNREIAPPKKGEEHLTVSLWLGQDRRVVTDWPLNEPDREVA